MASGSASSSSSSALVPVAADAAVPEDLFLNLQEDDVHQNYMMPAQPDDNFDDLLGMDVNQIAMTPDELEDLDIRMTGRFVLRVLNDLLNAGRWLEVIEYLANCVSYHAQDSVVHAPADASGAALVRIHRELFLYLHRQYLWELLENGDRQAAHQHYHQHVTPLAQTVPPGSRLGRLFSNLRLSVIYDLLRPGDLNVAAQGTRTEVRDYMFLYFPVFRPRRDGERSPMWVFGEQIIAENGSKGFRCYSCHREYHNVNPSRLSLHLLGGNPHQGNAPCPAVQLCTLERLAMIPHVYQQQAQEAAAAAQQAQEAAAAPQQVQEAAAAGEGVPAGQQQQDQEAGQGQGVDWGLD